MSALAVVGIVVLILLGIILVAWAALAFMAAMMSDQ